MITTPRTMPESDFTPEDSRDRSSHRENDLPVDELLNTSELQTVLDMLAVMETAEELTQLQALTEAQKRQVWEATPESLKQKLWQLRNQPAVRLSLPPSKLPSPEFSEDEVEQSETEAELDEDEIEDLGQDLELTAKSYPSSEANSTGTIQLELSVPQLQAQQPKVERSTPEVGDRVILKAHPKLTAAELKAIWDLQQIQGTAGEVYDAHLGTRVYPLNWLVVYAKPQSERAQSEQIEDSDSEDLDSEGLDSEDLDSEEAF